MFEIFRILIAFINEAKMTENFKGYLRFVNYFESHKDINRFRVIQNNLSSNKFQILSNFDACISMRNYIEK